MKTNRSLSQFQLFIILIHSQIGIGIITLPNDLFMVAKSDSWISVLLTGIFLQLLIFVYGVLMRRFPEQSLFEVVEFLFGKNLGKFINLIYCSCLILLGAALFVKFIAILKSWMLPLSPKWTLLLLIALLTIYIAKESIHIIVRFFILTIGVIFVFIGIALYTFKDANITYILPVGNTNWFSILKGVQTSFTSYHGVEYVLFLYPLVQDGRKQIIKTVSLANVFVTLFYTFIILACHLFFSSNELKLIPEPVFYLVKSLSFNIIERPDLIFISIWVVLVITTSSMLFYIITKGIKTVFSIKNQSYPLIAVVTLSVIVAFPFYGEYRLNDFSYVISQIIAILGVALPVLLIITSFILRKKGSSFQ